MESENSPGNVEDEGIFQEFCSNRGLAPSSIRMYKFALQKFVYFTGKTLEQLLDEAEAEEDENIRFRKRKLNFYLTNFKKWLEKVDYSKNYRSQIMISVTAFYNEYDIQLPRPKNRKSRSDRKIQTLDDLPSMDQIQKFIDNCNPLYKAIVTLGLSSGMSRAEICSLTFEHFYRAIPFARPPKTIPEIIDNLKDNDIIPLWYVKRIKTGTPFFTFCSPECVEKISEYLDFFHNKHPDYEPLPEDHLFRNIYRNQSLDPQSISSAFRTINKRCGFEKVENRILIRPHSLRKYFATVLERNKMPHLSTRWLLGHSIDSVTSAYFIADPEAVKQDYIEVLDQLTTNKVQIKVIDKYEDVRQDIDKLMENQKKFSFIIEKGKFPEGMLEYINELEEQRLSMNPPLTEEEMSEIYRKEMAEILRKNREEENE